MTYSELILSHSPSNYWKLNESSGLTAADSAGSAPGTLSGGVTLSQPGALADGTTAMAFDGVDDVIVTAGNVALLTPYTLEAWVKVPGALEMTALSTRAGYPTLDVVWLRVQPTNNFPTLTLDYANATSPEQTVTASLSIGGGGWHHLVAVVQSLSVGLYVDGVVKTNAVLPAAFTGTSMPLTFGKDQFAGFEAGSLDEIAIYPRALTPTEISDHYAARLTVSVPSAGCDHTTVWSKHLATLSAPTVESERAYLATLYGVPGGTDMSTLVSRWLQAITCGATSLEATLTPETVQTGTASAASADTLTLTFPGATGNGRGIVVGVISSSSSALPAGACSDNKGNAYTRILSQAGTGSSLAVYLCPTGVGGPVHTVTIAPALGALELLATAIEVRGVGAGLAVDASGSTTGTSSTPAATSGAVTTAGLISLALMGLDTAQASILVSATDGQSPAWLQEAEDLT